MPPKARAQDHERGPAPSRAPGSRVFRSTRPLQQVQFPGRRKVVKKYGRQGAVRSPKQRTLTQIGYVVPPPSDLYDTSLWEEEVEDDVESVDGAEMSVQEGGVDGQSKDRSDRTRSRTGTRAGGRTAKQDSKQSGRRRRVPASLPSSAFQTQTLTQFVPAGKRIWSTLDDDDNDDNDDDDDRNGENTGGTFGGTIQDSQNDDDVLGSPQVAYYTVPESQDDAAEGTPDGPRVIPQTPSKQRTGGTVDKTRRPEVPTATPETLRMEIPSSQPSPFTPVLLDRYHSPLGRQRSSPLQARAAAMAGRAEKMEDVGSVRDLSDRPGRGNRVSQKRKRGSSQIVPDSYTTAESFSPVVDSSATGLGDDAAKRRSPLRPLEPSEIVSRSSGQTTARRSTQENVERQDEGRPVLGDPWGQKPPDAYSMTPSKKRRRSDGPASHEEIPDSDGEDEDETPLALHPMSSGTAPSLGRHGMVDIEVEDDVEDAENRVVDDGSLDAAVDAIESSSSLSELDSGTPTPLLVKHNQQSSCSTEQHLSPARARTLRWATDKDNADAAADSELPDNTAHSSDMHDYQSQALESQRVPLEVIRALGPQTDRSDIILSIHPEQVKKIVDGSKDHEFRSYKIPQTVVRFWIYTTRPVCELQYMAVVSPGFRQPGEIDGASGVGNADFNAGRIYAKFAYRLMQVYQLNNPVSLETMKRNGWVDGPPQRYTYVPPAVVGSLLANLRCALFAEEDEKGEAELSISQEVEAQLLSDMSETQNQPVPPPSSSQAAPDVFARPANVRFQLAAVQTSRDGSERRAVVLDGAQPAAHSTTGLSQATTASCPSSQDPGSDGPGECAVVGNESSEKPDTTDTGGEADSKDDSDPETRPKMPVPDSQLSLPSQKTRWWQRQNRLWQQQQRKQQQQQQKHNQEASQRPGQAMPSSSTDSTQILLPDSLYEEVRQAPPAVILDSEDSDSDG